MNAHHSIAEKKKTKNAACFQVHSVKFDTLGPRRLLFGCANQRERAATKPMFILFGLLLCVDVMVTCETSDGGANLRPGFHRLSALAPRNARQSRIPVLFLSLRGGGKNSGTMPFPYPEGKGWEEDLSSTVAAVAAAWGKSCSGCGKRAPDGGNSSTSEKLLLRCSWCRQAFYCGKECQLAHWPTHKKGCPPTAASAPQPNLRKNETDADPDRPSVRIRRRIAEAEDIKERASANKGKLPKDCMDWKICRSCRSPVIIEWLDCPGCERPISDLDDEDTRGLMPEQTRMVQHTKILGHPQQDLLHGAETNNIPLMESAVSSGANFSVCDPELYNSGALHYAAGQGHLEAVTWLVQRGMTVDMPNSCDESPLHWAAESGHSKVIDMH
jgi:hypothetical protein